MFSCQGDQPEFVPPHVVEHTFQVRNPTGDLISGDLRYSAGAPPRGAVVICHGFTAFKDWGPFPYFGRRFAEYGYLSITFNFSHNGIGAHPLKFTEFEKFSRNTIGKEIEDLLAVIDAVERRSLCRGMPPPGPIGVVGHSRGGAVAIIGACEDRRIRCVAAWATVGTVFRATAHQREVWRRQGYLPISLRSTRTRLRLGREVLEDLEANRPRYDLDAAMRRIGIPVLLVHGRADRVVRIEEAESLYNASDKSMTELIELDRTGHVFGARQPFRGSHPTIDHVIDLTAQWFTHHLKERS